MNTDPKTTVACVARRIARSALLAVALATPSLAVAFDHEYAAFDALLRKYVAWNEAGVASSVDYRGLAAERAGLKKVLEELSSVTKPQYENWSKPQRLAFLVNAYNAFTVELILTKYPDLKSIKDLGSLFQSPWKRSFFRLLGEERHLDNVEHDMIRAPGAFDDPRIHFVVNCASIGCPALRPEAIVAPRLDAQFDDSTRRFLRDRSRNRYDPRSARLEVSKIFDWYREDFEKGHRGIVSREAFFAMHADLLADAPGDRQRVREQKAPIVFLDYDWALNGRR